MVNELIVIVIGLFIAYIGFEWLKKNQHLQKHGIKTIGTVVSTSSEKSTSIKDADGLYQTVYRSTVKFETTDKRIMEVELLENSIIEDPIGTEKKIIYDPQFPQGIKLNKYFNMVIVPWLFFGCGAFTVLWGLLELFDVTSVLK